MSRILAQGWVDVVRARNPAVPGLYSFWSNRGRARENDIGWRIDYVLASPSAMAYVQRAFIEPHVMGSDHCPIGVDLDPAIFG